MLMKGFLGTNADVLMDLVIVSFIVILPALCWSWGRARAKEYSQHKRIQLTLASLLAVAVVLFELDLKLSGGMAVLTKDSAYHGSSLLNSWMYGHTLVAISTALIWVTLVILSLRRFDVPPKPNTFSSTHRFWGRTGMITMMATGLSALPLYYYGFMN